MYQLNNTNELSSLEETRCQFNGGTGVIKLGIDVHQDFYVVVEQVGGSNPKPPQRFKKEAFVHWAAKLKKQGNPVHAVYEACGFGFGLQRQLSALGIDCHVVCPQKLDEQNRRVKTDGLDAKALCLKLDRFVQGNRAALARVRVPTEKEEQLRAIHRQREQLVKARKRLEAQGRSLMVNHGIEPTQQWWKGRAFAQLRVPTWMQELLATSQPILLALEQKIKTLTLQLQNAAEPTRLQSCVTKHGNPRLRAALVELAWRLVRFQPNYKPIVKWRATLVKGALATGAARKKAIVAVARQLAVDLWRIRTGRLQAQELGLIN
jgi:transposase